MTKLDIHGNEVRLPVETIKPVYHKPEQEFIAPPVLGHMGDVDARHTYSLEESTNASDTVKYGKKAK
jgi:hypothetical protein